MLMGQVVVVVVVVVTMCVAVTCAHGYNAPVNNFRHRLQMNPRCPSAAKPCRTRAIIHADFLQAGSREIRSAPCSCQSADCSDNWETHLDRIITRELITNGTIIMTYSMMFCTPIQPQLRCRSDQVALQLSGWTHMPSEVEFINCACPENRPLFLHSMTTGSDHKQYHSYVCIHHKKRCKRRRSNPDTCMEIDHETMTVRHPCRCTGHTSCQEEAVFPHRYICQR